MKITLFFELQTMVTKYKHSNGVFLLRGDVGLPARFPPLNELLQKNQDTYWQGSF